MTLPPAPAVEIAFEKFLKELPPDYAALAYQFKAFVRARKIKSPAQLLQVAMLYCGLDQALRSTAGSFALLQQRITDMAIHRRLKACGPWLKALLHALLPGTATASTSFRLLVVDGSSLQGPGAPGDPLARRGARPPPGRRLDSRSPSLAPGPLGGVPGGAS